MRRFLSARLCSGASRSLQNRASGPRTAAQCPRAGQGGSAGERSGAAARYDHLNPGSVSVGLHSEPTVLCFRSESVQPVRAAAEHDTEEHGGDHRPGPNAERGPGRVLHRAPGQHGCLRLGPW